MDALIQMVDIKKIFHTEDVETHALSGILVTIVAPFPKS